MEHTDEERIVLLAQIALEGVTLSQEVQAACSNGMLGAILQAAQRMSAQGLPPMRYVIRRVSGKDSVFPSFGALSLLGT